MFVFETAPVEGEYDTIVDFHMPTWPFQPEMIALSASAFTALSVGPLSAAAFRANTSGQAQDADDRIIYETDTGLFYYDADGSGSGDAILFVQLAADIAMTASMFDVF